MRQITDKSLICLVMTAPGATVYTSSRSALCLIVQFSQHTYAAFTQQQGQVLRWTMNKSLAKITACFATDALMGGIHVNRDSYQQAGYTDWRQRESARESRIPNEDLLPVRWDLLRPGIHTRDWNLLYADGPLAVRSSGLPSLASSPPWTSVFLSLAWEMTVT